MNSGKVNYFVGAWLILAALLRFSHGWIVMNNIVVGMTAAIIGCSSRKHKFCQGWLTAILGQWLIISIFTFGLMSDEAIYRNSLIVGILIMAGELGSGAKKLDKPKKFNIHLN